MGSRADQPLSPFCPRFHHAIELVGRRWTGAIIRAMFTGSTRFSDIAQTVPGLSDRLLSERLKELESEGLVSRLCLTAPARVEYHLTDQGRALAPAILAIADWAVEWLPLREHALEHEAATVS